MHAEMAKQERSNSNWEGMLKRWSVDQRTHHRACSYTSVYNNPALSGGPHYHPDPQWRGEAKKWFMIHEPGKYYDIGDRVYDISGSFMLHEDEDEAEGAEADEEDDEVKKMKEVKKVKKKEDLLDELQAYVESIDVASVLHSDYCLYPLLHHVLNNKHDGIRAKGAELVTTMVQNNPTSQQLVMDVNGLQLLLQNFTSNPDATSRTKALRAISSLIRNNKSGITAFRREKGYALLRKALISESVCQREALNLIQELNLAFSDDAEVRKAALSGLRLLARRKKGLKRRQMRAVDCLHLAIKPLSMKNLYYRLKKNKKSWETVASW